MNKFDSASFTFCLSVSFPVFVDAPHMLIPGGHSSLKTLRPTNSLSMTEGDPSLIPRAWWRSNEERTVYTGLNESLLFFRDLLRETTFQVRCKPFILSDLAENGRHHSPGCPGIQPGRCNGSCFSGCCE